MFLLKKITPCQKRFHLEVENSKNLIETQSSHRRCDKLLKNTKMLTTMSTMLSSCPWTRAIPPIFICLIFVSVLVRDGPLEKLWKLWRTMKIFAQGEINEKNSCMPINPKKFSCAFLKKLYKGNVYEKNSCGWKIPQPPLPPPPPFPMNFLMAVLWVIYELI